MPDGWRHEPRDRRGRWTEGGGVLGLATRGGVVKTVKTVAAVVAEPPGDSYAGRVRRLNTHPGDPGFRQRLLDFLRRPVQSHDGNVLRARGLTVQKQWSSATVIYRGRSREINLRIEKDDGLYRDATAEETEAAVAQAVQDLLAEHSGPAVQDTGEPSLLNPAHFAGIYDGFEHNGLKVRVNYSQRLADDGQAGELDADIMDGDKVVGHVTRNFRRDETGAYAYHNEFRVDPEYQSRGFGAALSAQSEDGYRKGDITRIDLTADEVGGYAWARAGYEAKSPKHIAAVVSSKMFDAYGGSWKNTMPTGVPAELQERWPEFLAFLGARRRETGAFDFEGGPASIQELAAWGSDRPVTVNGRQMWLGKWLLLGSSWDGSKRLD